MEASLAPLVVTKEVRGAVRSGKLSAEWVGISMVPGSYSKGRALLKLGELGESLDRTAGDLEGYLRLGMHAVVSYLKTLPEYCALEVPWVAPQVGQRSGRRASGKELLTEQWVLQGQKSAEEVGRGCWPIELWWGETAPEMVYTQEGDYYSITAGMLQSAHASNLLFAGRTISGTERALGSARVIATCMETGEAASRLACAQAAMRSLTCATKRVVGK